MKKICIFWLLILSLFIFVGCGEEKKESREIVSKKRDLTSDEISNIMNVIDKIIYLDYYNKDLIPRNMTNQEVLRVSYEILASQGKAASGKLKFSDLENVAMNYLGFGLEPENLVCDTHYNIQDDGGADIMIYDVKTGVYSNNSNHLGHGAGGLRTEVYNNYVSGYEDNGTYTIIVNKIFSEVLGDVYNSKKGYYATYSDASTNKNKLFEATIFGKEKFNDYKDNLVKYTYTFKLINEHYVLSSYKIG